MATSHIVCSDIAEFTIICAGLVRESVIFEADAHTLTIVFTGAF